MKIIFKNPITSNFEIGFIQKKHFTKQGIKCDILSEKGVSFLKLSYNKKKAGYIDEDLTNKFAEKIETNLNRISKGNFKNQIIDGIV